MAQKSLTTKELRALTEKELAEQLQQRGAELWQYRMKAKDGSLQQTHLLRVTRRQIARLNTLLKEQVLKEQVVG